MSSSQAGDHKLPPTPVEVRDAIRRGVAEAQAHRPPKRPGHWQVGPAKAIVLVLIALVVLTFLFPPWARTEYKGVVRGATPYEVHAHYWGPIWDRDEHAALDLPMLLAEWLAIVMVGSGAVYLVRPRHDGDAESFASWRRSG